jgi:hypothetical protein
MALLRPALGHPGPLRYGKTTIQLQNEEQAQVLARFADVPQRVLHPNDDRELDGGIHSKHVPESPKTAPKRDIGKSRNGMQIAE